MVRSVVERAHNVRMRLQMEGGIVPVVMVKEAGAGYSSLVDAKVRLRATAAPMFNKNSQMICVRLMARAFPRSRSWKPRPAIHFSSRSSRLTTCCVGTMVNVRYHRVHMRGTVTLQWPWPTRSLCIRDATRGICAQTDQDPQLALGDVVDVVGFVGTADGAPALTHPLFRKAGHNENIPAEPLTVEQVLQGKSDSELIQIDGQLIGYGQSNSDITLLLASGTNIFTCDSAQEPGGTCDEPWKVGSRLRVTGICSIQFDTKGSAATEGIADAESFRVLMRSPGDVAVLESPSWWTVVMRWRCWPWRCSSRCLCLAG